MPFINTKVNVPISKEQEITLKEKLGKAISLIPGKTEQWLMLGFESNYNLYFAGDNKATIAYVDVQIFGNEDKQAFANLTSELTKIFSETLNVLPNNMYIRYSPSLNWGWNGSNF